MFLCFSPDYTAFRHTKTDIIEKRYSNRILLKKTVLAGHEFICKNLFVRKILTKNVNMVYLATFYIFYFLSVVLKLKPGIISEKTVFKFQHFFLQTNF